MIKNIIKDTNFLKKPSQEYTNEIEVINDLVDTLNFNRKTCVGMASNMIGYLVKVIAFINEKDQIEIMVNPTIIKTEGSYLIKERCLSFDGEREVKRYRKIKVEYYTKDLQKRIK